MSGAGAHFDKVNDVKYILVTGGVMSGLGGYIGEDDRGEAFGFTTTKSGEAAIHSSGFAPATRGKFREDDAHDGFAVTGIKSGILSINKGITTSGIGMLLQHAGAKVTAIKIDPYLNMDAGTMSPHEHGECFVLDDGGEVDLDLGNYERFLGNITLTRDHNLTTGKINAHVGNKERKGDYLGKTVQMVPHVSDAIQGWIERVAQIPVCQDQSSKFWTGSISNRADICMIELGGTAGDIEGMIYQEALRQLITRLGRSRVCVVHVTHVPICNGEPKSKPAQQTLQAMRAAGLSPDLILCRTSHKEPHPPLSIMKICMDKIANYAMIKPTQVIDMITMSNLYHIPSYLLQQGVLDSIWNQLQMPPRPFMQQAIDMSQWNRWATILDQNDDRKTVRVLVVGKYTNVPDSYLSIKHALEHASMHFGYRVQCVLVDSDQWKPGMTQVEAEKLFGPFQGILIPGGFGERGIPGMIAAAKFAREYKVPFLGICLGMQVAVIELAQSLLKWGDATSAEFDAKSDHPVIFEMPEQTLVQQKGGTMRLGARETHVSPNTLAHKWYSYAMTTFPSSTSITCSNNLSKLPLIISERHRHRSEVNPLFIEDLKKVGARFSGVNVFTMDTTTTDKNKEIKNSKDSKHNQSKSSSLKTSTTVATATETTTATTAAMATAIDTKTKNDTNSTVPTEKEKGKEKEQDSDKRQQRMEILELKHTDDEARFYMGVQFHPEFRSRPHQPSPPFLGLIKACIGKKIYELGPVGCAGNAQTRVQGLWVR